MFDYLYIMKFVIFNICSFCFFFVFSYLFQDQEKHLFSNDYNELIYSGFLESQKKILIDNQYDLACKFKSMNRNTKKKDKNKVLVKKIKI